MPACRPPAINTCIYLSSCPVDPYLRVLCGLCVWPASFTNRTGVELRCVLRVSEHWNVSCVVIISCVWSGVCVYVCVWERVSECVYVCVCHSTVSSSVTDTLNNMLFWTRNLCVSFRSAFVFCFAVELGSLCKLIRHPTIGWAAWDTYNGIP